MAMRKWVWIAPMLLMAACSKNQAAPPQAATTDQVQHPAANPQTQQQTGQVLLSDGSAAPAGAVPAGAAPVAADRAAPVDAPTATVIPSGTPLRVRVDESLSTRHNRRGDRFTATLIDAVQVNGQNVLPAGTRLDGHVLVAAPSGRLKGRARLVLALDSFEENGQKHRIATTAAARVSRNHKKRNIAIIGGGAAT
jgi:hypothetical protein